MQMRCVWFCKPFSSAKFAVSLYFFLLLTIDLIYNTSIEEYFAVYNYFRGGCKYAIGNNNRHVQESL